MDQEQISILESGVEFEDYELAMSRAYECMRDAGITVDVRGVRTYHGVAILDTATSSTNAEAALVDHCYERHARYVDAYWQVSSPDAVAYAERRATTLKPLLQKCLTRKGIDWPVDASFEDLSALAFGPQQDLREFNCLDDIGYSDWDG